MEGTDGIEAAKKLWERDEDTILIFITGIREYVFQVFDVSAFHYLLKPVEEDKFHEVFHRAERELKKRKSKRRETVFIKTRNRSFSLEKDSILYIESRGKKVEIHTKGETIEAYASMNELEAQLGEGFFRCHRGYCIQFFFSRFAEPRIGRLRNAHWAAGIAWIMIKIVGGWLFRETDSVPLVLGLIFNTAVLFAFCAGWYKGNILLKVFLIIQFISLCELAFWAGYSFLYIGNSLIDILVYGAGDSMESAGYLPVVAGVLVSVLVRLLVITVTDGVPVLLYKRYPVLYLIIPMIALMLLGAIVFSFRIYQNMAALQEERAEKIILENQITQMQSSMVEMEHLYDGIRSVKHDMKNHMAVLQNLIRKKYSGEDEEIRKYFEGMYQSVEQLDNRVHTGNAVSDAVVGSKFHYAAKKVKGIKLDARGFMLSDAVTIKAYDMGIILDNGLDNAIEACIRMREKQPEAEAGITIRSFKAKDMYFIEIENSFDGAVLFHKDSGLPISAKEDKEVHGIGLKNIRKCAVKYGGDMDCIVKGNRFILSVMVKS